MLANDISQNYFCTYLHEIRGRIVQAPYYTMFAIKER